MQGKQNYSVKREIIHFNYYIIVFLKQFFYFSNKYIDDIYLIQ